ncbi:MAG: Fe-S protein assembly co-chaperone HscB [Bryobacteraceae bacterium]
MRDVVLIVMDRPPSNYFDFFGLPHNLNIDAKDLEARFYSLSRKFHPDLFARRPAEERQYSLDATAILNDGYRVLKDPVLRAEYILTAHGFPIGEQKSSNVPPELLEEVFELNMALEEIRGGDESVRPQLAEARQKFLAMRDESDGELSAQFSSYDGNKDHAALEQIRSILNKRRYIRNLIGEVEKERAGKETQ